MSKFISPRSALVRVVEDDEAPVGLRVQALKQIAHPPLVMLRRLIVDTSKRTTPVPPKLRALATIRYAHEVAFRKIRSVKTKAAQDNQPNGNALGI
jgi:hypothetical protein